MDNSCNLDPVVTGIPEPLPSSRPTGPLPFPPAVLETPPSNSATIVENMHYGAASSIGSQYSDPTRHYGTIRTKMHSLMNARSSHVDAYDTFDPQANPVLVSNTHYGSARTATLRVGATSEDTAGMAAEGFSNMTYQFGSAPLQHGVYSSVAELK